MSHRWLCHVQSSRSHHEHSRHDLFRYADRGISELPVGALGNRRITAKSPRGLMFPQSCAEVADMVPGWTEREALIAAWRRRDLIADMERTHQSKSIPKQTAVARNVRMWLKNARVRVSGWFGPSGADKRFAARFRPAHFDSRSKPIASFES
jgi:hypothetical protein